MVSKSAVVSTVVYISKMEAKQRETILELARAHHGLATIKKLTGYLKLTVYGIYKAWKEKGVSQQCAPKPRSDKKQTPTFLARLKRTIAAMPTMNQTQLAIKKGVSPRTIKRAMKDLRLKSYRLSVCHLLTTKMKDTREVRCKALLSRLKKRDVGHTILFSDEKTFTLDQSRNSQNDQYIATMRENVPPVHKTKNPASIMVYGLITSDGKAMRSHFFKPKEKVNTVVYVNMLKKKVVPWVKENVAEPYIYQQDSAPCHTSKTSLAFLESNMFNYWGPKTWPSNSPDLNLMDYFF